MKVLAIADDLTGAAEIAGIGWRFGLPVRLLREPARDAFAGLTVIDTNSRSMSPDNAAAAVRQTLATIDGSAFDLVYKKIDSVFRGPVVAEVEAALSALHRERAMLLPQNPTRGRTIENGIYSIDGTPLHETTFAHDPEYPTNSSLARQRIGLSDSASPIQITDACSFAQVTRAVAGLTVDTLPVGGADFFTAILQSRGLSPKRDDYAALRVGTTLFICGTASSQRDELAARAARESVRVCPMPDEVFNDAPNSSAAGDRWTDEAVTALRTGGKCVMLIPQSPDRQQGTAQRLLAATSAAAGRVIDQTMPSNVLMEGGATASAICRRVSWGQFQVIGELARGVVCMTPRSVRPISIVLKPGSYPWPETVWR